MQYQGLILCRSASRAVSAGVRAGIAAALGFAAVSGGGSNRAMAQTLDAAFGLNQAQELAPAPAQTIQDADHVLYANFKDVRSRRVEGTRVAFELVIQMAFVDLPEDLRTSLKASLIAAGVDPESIVATPVDGWYTANLLGANAGGAAVRDAVAALLADPMVAFAGPVLVGEANLPIWPTGNMLVGFTKLTGVGAGRGERELLLKEFIVGAPDYRWQIMPDACRVELVTRNGFEAMEIAVRLAEAGIVEFSENDLIYTARHEFTPNDAQYGSLWGLHNTGQSGGTVDRDMDAPEAWDITTGSNSIITVVLDVGVQLDHPDLNLAPSINYASGTSSGGPANSCDNHGTAVASCISARINNAIGVVGIAPTTRVASARIGSSTVPCNGTWNGLLSWNADALNWAQGQGARVSNNSNGYGTTSTVVETAYNNTKALGMVHFVSAGNDGTGTIGYPSSIASVNSVAALNRTGARASFSQFGTGLDFSAPGESIDACDRTGANGYGSGDYTIIDGTSFSSPYAAGVAALILSRNPALTAAQVESIMQTTAVDLGTAGYDTGFGWGFVNANAAVLAASSVSFQGTGINTIADVTGNGNNNGRIDSGESSIGVTIQLRNTGTSTATGVSATLTSSTPTVTVTTNASAYPNIAGSNGLGTNSTPYVINVSSSHVCGTPISLSLAITSGQGTGNYAFALPTGLASNGAPVTVAYAGAVVAIPDNNATGANATITVAGFTGVIGDLNFRINGTSCNSTAGSTTVGLNHTYVGDLTLTLQSPSGTVVTLINSTTSNGGNNFCNTVFDDEGVNSITTIAAGGNPYSATFIPAGSLAVFDEENPNGVWTLRAVDTAATDTGSIRAFSLVFTPKTYACGFVCNAPVITLQPVALARCASTSASFSVVATGAATYQWRKNSVNIVGATSPTYTIASVVAGDAGNYDCVATSACSASTTSAAVALTSNTNATISSQPVAIARCLGTSASFNVVATGTGLTYQWRKNTVNIGGATSPTYTIASVVAGDAASYDCVVTGTCDNVTSFAVALTVNINVAITAQPVAIVRCTGTSASFSVVVTGTGLAYQWRRNGVILVGATSPTFTIPSVLAVNSGFYDCAITGTCSSATSSTVALTVNTAASITTNPVALARCPGTSATFTIVANGASLTYQWRKNAVNIVGATSPSYTIASVITGDEASYDCVVTGTCNSATSSAAVLGINSLVNIVSNPPNVTTCVGSAASFFVNANGTSIAYQWRKNTVNIGGATSPTYAIPVVVAGDAGSYDCVITGTCNTVTSVPATLALNANTTITTQPAAITRCPGESATFNVSASGTSLAYQWRRNTIDITGATSPSFFIASVSAGDSGNYDCVVTGTCGSTTSNAAALTVSQPASITSDPLSLARCEGTSASFNVVATGDGLTFQWRKNTIDIGGATSPNYVIAAVSLGDAGNYDCVITGTCNVVTTLSASLAINTAPTITTNPLLAQACEGGSAIFTLSASASVPLPAYAWRKDGILVSDDPGRISGSNTNTLTIASAVASDAGSYDCVVTNVCATAISQAAAFTVLESSDPACTTCTACAADYNQDGGITGDDISAFFADYDSGETCADVNQDGGITGDDIAFFFTAYEDGGC